MSKKSHSSAPSKRAAADRIPAGGKDPRVSQAPSDSNSVVLKYDQMDMDGPWGWRQFEIAKIQWLLMKLSDLHKLNWQELTSQGSHLVDIVKLVPKAQKRLEELKKDDLDQLYSLRTTGRHRIWGIKESSILWLLWWDPEHEVCPSNAKNN